MNRLVEYVDHVQVPVSDIKKAVNWYCDVLGLEKLTVISNAAWLKFGSGPVLMLHYSTKNERTFWLADNDFPMPSFMFLTKDIRVLHSVLKDHNVKIREYENHGHGWVVKFVDPFGNELGAFQPNNQEEE